MRSAGWGPASGRKEGYELSIEGRKDDHIDICLTEKVSAERNWWDDVMLTHEAIPSCDLDDVDLRTSFLGRSLEAPIIISAMTGGSKRALEYNRMMAKAAQEFGLGMGVGSQRAGIERPQYRATYEVVRDYDVPLLMGNIGAPQIVRAKDMEDAALMISSSIDMIGAHAVCLHLNYLQEVVQQEGETRAEDLIVRVKGLSSRFPIVAKETGAGLSRSSAVALRDAGIAALDVGGMSGTSFSAVESFRSKPGKERPMRLGRAFWNWGIPSPASVIFSKVGIPLIASGGIRNGLDAARGIALGADCSGMARNLLIAASKGYEDLAQEIGMVIDELKASIFLCGKDSARALKGSCAIVVGPTREYLGYEGHIDYPGTGI
ncbi:MAG: type 2 isopentenyl-diphosphate Delta-isomerase [Candidatus Thermoplasmatota archaeon]|nr:type 2 isopentenyl-diphosphate Delta-isomerase [Candidatus Thermoplasmatota archaeon]